MKPQTALRIPSSSTRPSRLLKLPLAILFCLSLAATAAAQGGKFIVTTTKGKIQGRVYGSHGAQFLGIPYAQPPVGNLRWRAPLAMEPWSGVRSATTFGAPCAQPDLGDWNRKDAAKSQEDCLFVNVITPEWPPKGKLPVMFWIHGGANEGGTASSALYKDGTLTQHGILLVTINYRLGVFGFFALPGLTRESAHHSSGNYGLLDQIAALHWVHDNIARFGGDPSNITVFGQSAGAMDTGTLMTSPLAGGLFQRAIEESGGAFSSSTPPLAVAEQAGEKLATALGAPAGAGRLAYLRNLSAAALIKGRRRAGGGPMPNAVVDGWFLPRSPAEVFASGREAPIPLIIGTTAREFGMKGPAEAVRKFIEREYGGLAPQAFKLYGLADGGKGKNDPLFGPVGDQWLADFLFRCPSVTQAAWHVAAHQPVYEYQFEHAIPGQEDQGAVHSSELPYVFGYYPKTGNISGPFTKVDFNLATLMETYWTNFAKTGNPNGGSAPDWPQFDSTQKYIRFTESGRVGVAEALRRPECRIYQEALEKSFHQEK